MRQKKVHKVLCVTFGFFISCCAILASMVVMMCYLSCAYRMVCYPKTSGTVVLSCIQSQANSRKVMLYNPHVVASYKVNDDNYETQMIRPISIRRSNFRFISEEICGKFALGKKVDIYYMPSSPSNSFLFHFGKLELVSMILSMLFFVVGCLVGYRCLKSLKQQTMM